MRIEITVLGGRQRQKIHSFGASDAWCTEVVGRWPAEQKEAIARLLFDTAQDEEGRPYGIGLSCWRILAGAGKTVANSDDWRSSDTFLQDDWRKRGIEDDTSYDFSRCPGQRWFIHAAHRYHVPFFVLFAHSPPAPLTANRQTLPDDNACNLKVGEEFRAREFAVYLCKIMAHFERIGVYFAAVSPVHEPHWQCDDSHVEGCSYTNEEVGRVMRALERETEFKTQRPKVGVPEAGTVDYLTQPIPAYEKCSDFIRSYFGDGRVVPAEQLLLITGHSYFTCWPQEDRLISSREALADAMGPSVRHGAQYWMTEYSIYIPVGEKFVPDAVERALSPGGRDDGVHDRSGIDAALWVARVIHCDLAVAGASAWHYWLALSPDDFPDGLIRFSAPGEYTVSKTLYVLGHYSRFVRPGMMRVDVNRSDDLVERESVEGLMVSAYIGHGRVVVVAVNIGHVDEEVHLCLSECGDILPGATWFSGFITSASTNLAPYRTFRLGGAMKVPKRSVVTCVAEMVEDGDQYYLVAAGSEHGLPLCLEVSHGSPHRCAIVGIGRLAGHSHQLWQLNGSQGGMTLAACHTGFVLDVVNEATTPKSPLHQNSRGAGRVSQVWELERLPSGNVYLTVQHSRHVLEAYGNSVRVNIRTGKPEQLWMLVSHGADLSNLPINPALNAAQLQRKTTAAWSGDWVDDLPPPMASVPTIRKPVSRYTGGAQQPQKGSEDSHESSVASKRESSRKAKPAHGSDERRRPARKPQDHPAAAAPAASGGATAGKRFSSSSASSQVASGSGRQGDPGGVLGSRSEAHSAPVLDEGSDSDPDDASVAPDSDGPSFQLNIRGVERNTFYQMEQHLKRLIADAAGLQTDNVELHVAGSDPTGLLLDVHIRGVGRLSESQVRRVQKATSQRQDTDVASAATSSESDPPIQAPKERRKKSRR